ncbi:Tpt1/KptA family RNA 2'-phosphotransferase [Colletotrichum scovillei]|uniref:2'-phosphotransferase n=1 Tax=Colletotrichum scovillei TaxID=1209932 RepID=A0A9P7UJ43_9PEZI|nr:Tpt1/KptA family RNA 2'-phosphotransferase [Colletotrichum scovillei]KAG7070326.1 Tpt1/KptA family RNA 2'-phosphotransferase [Colletotrichum scovillei]KAG7078577.1 Tpt1/KptA family RNA 2'-phosphotransferase [Colletotrichum scovillei]
MPSRLFGSSVSSSSRRIKQLASRGFGSKRPLSLHLSATFATQSRTPLAPPSSTARGTTRNYTRWKTTFQSQRFAGSILFPAHFKSSWAQRNGEMADQFEETAPAAGDSAQQQKRGGGGGGRRGGRGGGGRGGGGGGQPREVLVSKALSKLLRHQAENAGLKLDEGGYAPLDKVLAYGPIKSLKVTFSDIQAAVTTSDKQRFALKLNPTAAAETSKELSTEPSDWLIRANQGHSIKVESAGLLTPITLEAGNVPAVVVHGTYFAFWKQIEASGGLKRMGRNHVHFATGLPGDEKGVVSGMRKDAEVLVYVDVERALREEEGIKWWVSENGVVLTEGDGEGVVPCRLFKEVVARDEGSGVGVLWRDGEKVGELPEGLRMRTPPGKGRGGRGGGGGRRGGKA